jgi:hypothetical protein
LQDTVDPTIRALMALITEEWKVSVQAVKLDVDTKFEHWKRIVFGGSYAFDHCQ